MTGIRSTLLLVAASVSLGLFAASPASAATKSPAMQACSDQWAKLKADAKVPEGQTWPQFWSQCAKDYAAAHPEEAAPAAKAAATTAAPAATTAAAPAAAPAEPAPKKAAKAKAAEPAKVQEPAMAAEPAGKGKSPAMQACSDQWAKDKAAGTVPAGQTWPKFWSQCSKDYAAAHPAEEPAKAAKSTKAAAPVAVEPAAVDAEDGVAVPEPEVAAKINPDKTTVNKREPTPGQKAAIIRIRACGAEWQANKKAGKLPEGAKWPQYWSDCNKRLKAQGQ